MSWSNRAVRDEDGIITVREVFWKEDAHDVHLYDLTYEHVEGWTEGAVAPQGESVEQVRKELDRFVEALALPVLSEDTMYKHLREKPCQTD